MKSDYYILRTCKVRNQEPISTAASKRKQDQNWRDADEVTCQKPNVQVRVKLIGTRA